MTNKVPAGFLIVLLATGLAACDDPRSPSTPTSPWPIPLTGPPPTESPRNATVLRGAVYDTVFRPLAGARVEVVGGTDGGASTTTDATGVFSFTGTFDDTTQVRAVLDGHLAATQTVSTCATCRFYFVNFYLAVPVPPVSIAGEYTLTFVADGACTDMPTDVRARSYTATVTARSFPSLPPRAFFITL